MKTTKTYSIEESIYNAFDSLTTERNINKSSFIEEYIKKFLKENNMEFVDKLYCLRTEPEHIVTVVSQDATYYFLNDGSKVQKILFLHLFREYDSVNPDEFFNKSAPILEGIAEKIKNLNLDESTIPFVNRVTLDELMEKLDKSSYVNNEIEQKDILNEINNNYKSGYYINRTKLELCEVIIKLIELDFSKGTKEHDLQCLLIEILEGYKKSL